MNPTDAPTLSFRKSDVDEDGRVELYPSSDKPLPAFEDRVVLQDEEGNVYLADVLDFHDAYEFGGEPSFLWVELV